MSASTVTTTRRLRRSIVRLAASCYFMAARAAHAPTEAERAKAAQIAQQLAAGAMFWAKRLPQRNAAS